jgi:hypothetical protein
MTKIKPIEQLAEDVRKGDLVRIFTDWINHPAMAINGPEEREYTGYFNEKEGDNLTFQDLSNYTGPDTHRINFRPEDNALVLERSTLRAKSYEILRRHKR